jgi:acetyl esterase/lipase
MENCPHDLPEENRIQGIILYAAGGIDSAYPRIDDDQRQRIESVIDSQMDGSEPPFLILHGTIDTLDRAESSEHFAALLDAAEVENTLVILDEVGHFFINPESKAGAEAITYVDEFLTDIFAADEDTESPESDPTDAD